MYASKHIFTVRNSGCGKVMFHRCLSVHRGKHAWQGGMRGRGHVWQGVCIVGGCAWQGGCMAEEVCVLQGDMCGRRDGLCSRRYTSY